MKSLIEKDKKRRKLYTLYEKKRIILKYLHGNIKLPLQVRKNAYKQLVMLPKNSSLVRLRSRCILTNRGRAVYKIFKISRLMFRQLALQGNIPGIKKASW